MDALARPTNPTNIRRENFRGKWKKHRAERFMPIHYGNIVFDEGKRIYIIRINGDSKKVVRPFMRDVYRITGN